VRGRTQREIGIQVGVSQVAVCRILGRIEDRLLATLHRERVRYLTRHYARAEHVYAQAQEGWDRSCAEQQRRTQRRTTTGKDGSIEHTAMSVVTETQPGDPRFLREQLRALAEQREAFQLDALDWVQISTTLEGDPALPPEEEER